MVSHMKTTIELPDSLLTAAKTAAAKDHTTLRALIEQGLRIVLARRKSKTRFLIRDGSVDGDGLQPDIQEGDWGCIRDRIYEGRGS